MPKIPGEMTAILCGCHACCCVTQTCVMSVKADRVNTQMQKVVLAGTEPSDTL